MRRLLLSVASVVTLSKMAIAASPTDKIFRTGRTKTERVFENLQDHETQIDQVVQSTQIFKDGDHIHIAYRLNDAENLKAYIKTLEAKKSYYMTNPQAANPTWNQSQVEYYQKQIELAPKAKNIPIITQKFDLAGEKDTAQKAATFIRDQMNKGSRIWIIDQLPASEIAAGERALAHAKMGVAVVGAAAVVVAEQYLESRAKQNAESAQGAPEMKSYSTNGAH